MAVTLLSHESFQSVRSLLGYRLPQEISFVLSSVSSPWSSNLSCKQTNEKVSRRQALNDQAQMAQRATTRVFHFSCFSWTEFSGLSISSEYVAGALRSLSTWLSFIPTGNMKNDKWYGIIILSVPDEKIGLPQKVGHNLQPRFLKNLLFYLLFNLHYQNFWFIKSSR